MMTPRDRPNYKERYEALLNPDTLRQSLLIMSVFIAAYELLRERVVTHLQYFYADSFSREGPALGPDYQQRVRSRHRSEVQACLLWFRQINALTDEDLSTFDLLRQLRNKVVHELFDRIGSSTVLECASRLNDLVALLRRIEVWWILNVERPTDDAEFADKEIIEDDIIPGPIMALKLLVDVALGSDEDAWKYLKAYENLGRGSDASPKGTG